MKKLIWIVVSFVCMQNLKAQDLMIMKTGDEKEVKVTDISAAEIKYKKWSNPNGPTYTVDRKEVFMIKYENGEKDVFNEEHPTPTASTPKEPEQGPLLVKKAPADNNQAIIKAHNPELFLCNSPKPKNAKYLFPVMGMSDSSLVSTEDLEMKIVPTIICNLNFTFSYHVKYTIELKNKTDRIIYVDLANTFRIYTDGSSKNYFDTEQTVVTQGSGAGVGVNAGGVANALGIGGIVGSLANAVSVGGASQRSVSTSYSQQRILAIPPHSQKNLSEFKQVHIKGNNYKTISDLDNYAFNYNPRGQLKRGGYILFDEAQSPYTAQHYITYSTSPDFSTYSVLHAKLYARCIIGFQNYIICRKREKAIKARQKYVSNFWEDPGVIVGDIGQCWN